MDEEAYRMVALRLLPLLLNDKAIYYRDFEVGERRTDSGEGLTFLDLQYPLHCTAVKSLL